MYSTGKSKKQALESLNEEALKDYKNFKGTNSPSTDLFEIDPSIKPLLTFHHAFIWSGFLIKNGMNIDGKLDDLLNEVVIKRDGLFAYKGPIKKILKNLLDMKDDVRNYEVDIEEFLNAVATQDHLRTSNHGTIVTVMLNQINNTLSRTYDLCKLKLNSIYSTRVTFTNIMLSVIAIAIAVFALLNKA